MLGLLLANVWAAPNLQPKFTGDESFAESYTAIVDLEDGTYILAQILFTNAGFGDQKAGCRALVVPNGTQGVNGSLQLDSGEWEGKPNRLQIGDCFLSVENQKTHFHVAAQGVFADLVISQAPKKYNEPDGRIQNDGFYESEVLIAAAQVQATYKTKLGSGAQKGWAYLDHARSNTLLPQIASKWYRFRGFYGDEQILIQVRNPPNGAASQGWVLRGGAIESVQSSNVVSGNGELKVTIDGIELWVRGTDLIYRYEPAKAYGAIGALAQPWIGKPVTLTWRAELSGVEAPVRGILEEASINE
ncbi:MAG: hypothetical protein CMK59_12815 [Proteobacteria bacterium]|nr:hypothetical protein [Pseudomonadota bacterium]